MRRIVGAAAALVLCTFAAACARPIGDFDRARSTILHDEVMPTAGNARAYLSGEPYSSFNLTDQEREMHDRVWRFLVAPHADDWFMDTVVEWQRTRLIPRADERFDRDRYFRWLRRTRYESSRVRYRTLADDAKADLGTVHETFVSICRVIEVDRQRLVASRGLDGLGADEVAARRAENELRIAWFTRALRYRYDSYDYALNHLLVETPHEEAVEADARLSELAIWVEWAERGEFCIDAAIGTRHERDRVPSRVLLPKRDEGLYLK